MLTLIALVLLLGTSIAQSFLYFYLVQARMEFDWDHQRLSWVLSAIGLVASGLRALGVGLLLAAVFMGRKPAWQHQPNRGAPRPALPAPPHSEERGISERRE